VSTTWSTSCQKCGTRFSAPWGRLLSVKTWWHVVRCAPEYGWQLRSLWRELLGRSTEEGT
jgi:hypothetical protein